MSIEVVAFRKFVQVEGTPGQRTQFFAAAERGNLIAGEIVGRQDRQLIANVCIGLRPVAIKIEMYADSLPDYSVQPVASAFILSILPWDVYKVERFGLGTRWVQAEPSGKVQASRLNPASGNIEG